ncbi:uncharacterized [Tachysurus ichikawai]
MHEVIARRVTAVSVTSLSKLYASCSHTSVNAGLSTIRLKPSWTLDGRAVPSAAAEPEKVMPSWPLWHVQRERESGRSGLSGQNRECIGHAYENGHENLGLSIKSSSVVLYLV